MAAGTVNKFEKAMRTLMLSDKDYILKSGRAFVSFARSYKEHKLSNLLKFTTLDPISAARSFFLFKLPALKEFKDLELDQSQLATPEELAKFEAVEFKDKNQEQMIKKKIEEAIEARKDKVEKRAAIKEQREKEQDKKKIRSKAERQRAKKRETQKQFDEFSKENKLKKLMKSGRISKSEYEEQLNKIDRKYEY